MSVLLNHCTNRLEESLEVKHLHGRPGSVYLIAVHGWWPVQMKFRSQIGRNFNAGNNAAQALSSQLWRRLERHRREELS